MTDKRGAAVQSTENDDKATPANDALKLLHVADSLGSGAEFDVADVDALTRHIDALTSALAAERDRADRAEAVIEEIRNAITTTDEGWMIADDDKLAEILEAAQ